VAFSWVAYIRSTSAGQQTIALCRHGRFGVRFVQVDKDACPKQKKMRSGLNIHYHDVNVTPKRQDSRFFGVISCDITTEIAAKAMHHNATPLQNVTD